MRFLSTFLLGAVLAAGAYHLWQREPAPPARPTVVVAVSRLARLEGARAHFEQVFSVNDKSPQLFGLVESEAELLYLAVADAVAGVDLSTLGADAIEVDGRNVTIALPKPQLFSLVLDASASRVFAFRKDWLSQAKRDALESRAETQALEALRAVVNESDLYEQAEASAEQTLRNLLLGLGFETVRFIRSTPRG